MKIIKITTNNIIENIECDFSNCNLLAINKKIHELIGNECSQYSLSSTTLLYKSLGSEFWNSRSYISSLTMLVDEDGFFKSPINKIASNISGTIVKGNVLIVSIVSNSNELDISGFTDEDALFITDSIKTIFNN